MEASMQKAQSATAILCAVMETNSALSEMIATKTSEDMLLSESGRDGLANIFVMINEKLAIALDLIDKMQK